MKDIYCLGVVEYMKLLQLLHEEGYQRLRWFFYFAPTGCSFRCHITTQDNLFANRELVSYSKDDVWSISVNKETTGEDVKYYLPKLKNELGSLLAKGEGEDAAYYYWYGSLLKSVLAGKGLPVYQGEFYSAPTGHIKQGDVIISGPPMSLTLISWNIDGIKAHFDYLKFLVDKYNPGIICLQKTKDVNNTVNLELPGYRRESSQSKYAGVMTYIKNCIPFRSVDIKTDSNIAGHLLVNEILYPHFYLFNVYTPYSNPSIEGAVEHRKEFDAFLQKQVLDLPDRKILCGDMNIVVDERDCWDRKYKRNQANFHEWERTAFLDLLDKGGLFDTYRASHSFDSDFSYFFRNDKVVREKNQGHRIDYFLASRSLEPNITRAEILKDFAVTTNDPILLRFGY